MVATMAFDIANVRHENTLKTQFINHLTLAHSQCVLQGMENFNEVDFSPIIHERLRKLTINKVYRIQVFSWSHVMDGNSLFVISPRKTGKTWSYIPAICNQLWKESKIRSSPDKCYGPTSIILVPSAKDVEEIYAVCRCLMFNSQVTVVITFGVRDLTDTKVQLLNGCDVLIATASSLDRILKLNTTENLINGARLKRIVIDNMNEMLARCHTEFYSALNTLIKICGKVHGGQRITPQLIITSKDWDGAFKHLMAVATNPLLVMGDFVEAAVYGQTSISIKLCSKHSKDDEIIAFIQKLTISSSAGSRTLIVCNDDDEVKHLAKVLWQNGFCTITYSSSATEKDRQMVDEWQYLEVSSMHLYLHSPHYNN